MKELFENLPRLRLYDHCDFLLDTCFFAWVFEHNKEKDFDKLLGYKTCAMTSFNADEMVHISHQLNDKVREGARRQLRKASNFFLLEVPVHPGDRQRELDFVKSIVPEFNCVEHDPSDGVILAAAVSTGATILTRDKHDLFNVRIENCVNKYGIKVINTFERLV